MKIYFREQIRKFSGVRQKLIGLTEISGILTTFQQNTAVDDRYKTQRG